MNSAKNFLFNCNNCKYVCKTRKKLNSHKETHRLKFKCKICKISFSQPGLLKNHNFRHQENNPWTCNVCKKQFLTKAGFNLHLETHQEKRKKYPCDFCSSLFLTKSGLFQHKRSVHEIKEYSNYNCLFCGKNLPTETRFLEHLLIHTNERPYFCKICGKGFNRTHGWRLHCRTHNPEKKLIKCNLCPKTFSHWNSLLWHIQKHTGEVPFKCSLCKKRFKNFQGLKLHRRKFHRQEKDAQCIFCNKSLSDFWTLQCHLRLHTQEKPYFCQRCPKTFSQLPHLKQHLRVHESIKPYSCEVCKVSYADKGNLKVHMRIHTRDRPYKCTVCLKTYRQATHLKTHLMIHEGVKPFSCDSCGKSFNDKWYLRKHLKAHCKNKPFSTQAVLRASSMQNILKCIKAESS